MKIVKRASDNVVLFAGEDLALDQYGVSGNGWRYTSITTANAILETVNSLPDNFAPGEWTYAGGVWTPSASIDAIILANAKADKLVELQTSFDADVYADIVYNSITFVADEAAQLYLAKALSVGSVPAGMFWRDVNGTQQSMTFADLQGLGLEIMTRTLAAESNMDTKKAAVNAATSVSEVDAISW